NDTATRTPGETRTFVSKGLNEDRAYNFTIRAEVMRDGELVTETKTIELRGGEAGSVEFNFDGEQQVATTPVKTALILRVPADAKVTLAGQPTSSTGEVREFATTRLAQGSEWMQYPVRVEIERDGQVLTQERMVAIKGGEVREVSFDFDAASLASK